MLRTAGNPRSWLALGGLALAAATQPLACVDKSGDDTAAGETLLALLAAVGPEVVLPALEGFVAEAEGLEQAAGAWAAAPEDDVARGDAQAAWLSTMSAWQQLEVMQLGPAGSSLSALGGQDLRDEIYSWPTVNACRVDQETAASSWEAEDFFTANLVTSYGLDALERSLWGGAENDCPSQVDINADGTWATLGEAGVRERRAAFAEALSAHVREQGEGLVEAWSPSGGDFSGALARAGDGAPYPSALLGLNAVYDALFYLESELKEVKLGVPAAVDGCDADACPEAVELLASEASLMAVTANLQGFRLLFTGGEGVGMDDLLTERGHGDLSDDILSHLDAAIGLAEGIEGPLQVAVVERGEEVRALYDEVKAVADLLKGDLATVLSLQVPAEAAGDAD
ncbi:MAG: imelysin family protein [Alphaproteobacteria bacterium]|nr:imelysin family protein [Alphaproteobacteria bacterium]